MFGYADRHVVLAQLPSSLKDRVGERPHKEYQIDFLKSGFVRYLIQLYYLYALSVLTERTNLIVLYTTVHVAANANKAL